MAKSVITTHKAGLPLGAYSQGFRVGDFVYTAGTGPIDPETGKVVGETLEEQTRRVLDNIKAVLEAGGATINDVFKMNVYLADPGMFRRFNAIYAEYFTDPKTGANDGRCASGSGAGDVGRDRGYRLRGERSD